MARPTEQATTTRPAAPRTEDGPETSAPAPTVRAAPDRQPSGHAASRYQPGQAVAMTRLLTSSAVPMPAPGTIALRGPTVQPWDTPLVEVPSDVSDTAQTDGLVRQPDGSFAPPEPASVTAEEDVAGALDPVTGEPLRGGAPPPVRDVSGLGFGLRYSLSVEELPARRKAVLRSGVAPVDVDPLTSERAEAPDEQSAADAQRAVAREEAELDGELTGSGGEREVAPEGDGVAVPAAPDVVPPAEEGGVEAPAEGGATDDVAAWQGRVQGSVTAMPTPEAKPPGTYSNAIVAAGGGGAAALAKKAEEIPLEAKKVLEAKPVKPLPDAPGIPAPDPVPKATLRLKQLAARSLFDQKLPQLVATPNGFLPTVGGPPLDTKAPPPAPPAPRTTAGAKSKTPAKAVNDAVAQGPPEPVPGQGQTVTGSKEPPPARTVAEPHRAQIAQVLARVYLQAETLGPEVVKDARATAYGVDLSGGELATIGQEREQVETVWFRQEMGRVADAAQIGKAALDSAVTERAKELEKGNEAHAVQVVTAAQEQVEKANEAGSRAKEAAGASYRAWEEYFDDLSARAKGGVDPKAIRAEEARAAEEMRSFARVHTSAWAALRKVRERDLVRAGEDQVTAYKQAALADQAKRAAPAPKAPPPVAGKPVPAPVSELTDPDLVAWLTARTTEVGKAVRELLTEVGRWVDGWTTDLTTARDEGIESARTWADGRIGRERGWFDSLIAQWLQSLMGKQEENAAIEQTQTQETVEALGDTLQVINDLKMQGSENLDRDGRETLGRLTDEEGALLKAYFAPDGAAKGDTVLLLASMLGIRLRRQRRAGAQQYIRDEVLALDNAKNWKALETIGISQNEKFNAQTTADQLWQAFEYTWGTDEEKAIAAVKGGLTAEQSKAVRGAYTASGYGDLDKRMDEELSGTDYQRVAYGFDNRQAEADAAALAEGMGHVFSPDQTLVTDTLRNKTEPERKAIAAAYKRMYGVDLTMSFALQFRGDDNRIVNALWVGNTEKADAIEIKQAREGFWGPDHEKIEQVYTRVRDEATKQGDARGWKTAKIDEEIARRTGKMAGEYQEYTKRGLVQDLTTSFSPPASTFASPAQQKAADQFWAGRRDLVLGLATGNLTQADAGKIQIERTGLYAKDETVNKVLGLQYSRAYENAKRDALVDFKAAHHNKAPNKEELAALEKAAETTAKQQGQASMTKLGTYVQEHYTGPAESFRDTIEGLTSGTDEEKALTLVDQGGFLEDWQVLEFSAKGAGTDEDELTRVLKKQKTKAQQDELEKLWQRKTGTKRTIAELISDETSGRLENDLLLDNKFGGDPEDPAVMVAKAGEQLDFERRSGGEDTVRDSFGRVRTVKSPEFLELERRLEDLKTQAKAKEATAHLPVDDPRRVWAEMQLGARVAGFASGIETNRFMVDQRTELAAQIITMAVAITVAVVISVATAGTAAAPSVAMVAFVSSLFGAAAGIATKMAMKGPAYGTDELAMDIVLGVADAGVSALTAGMGGKLLKSATTAARVGGSSAKGLAVTIGRMAEGTALKRAAAHAITEGAEGFLQSLPTAVLGTALNEKTWQQGNPLFNMLAGVGVGVGMGTFASGTIGGLTNLRGPKGVHLPEPGNIPAIQGRLVDLVPGTAEHAHLEARYFEVNPSRTKADFQRDLDGLVMLQAKYNPEVAARLENRLRENVLDLLPAGSNVPEHGIEMWDTKRFEEFTGSRSGQAIVVVKDGRPTVVVKQGADPHELAQEGFHLLQTVDPKTSGKVARLNESVMSRWSSLDVREKLALYKEKIDLELDAQRRMVTALEERAGRAQGLDDGLAERLASAKETLGNLERRAGELASITPFQRQLMAWGVLQPASWLDQPARLFAKTTPPKPKAGGKGTGKGKGKGTKKPAPVAPPAPPRPVEVVAIEVGHTKDFARHIEDAHAAGRTIEKGGSVEIKDPNHPRLRDQLATMRREVQTFDQAVAALGPTPDPAAFEAAALRLRRAVSDTNEVMRSFGARFDVTEKVSHVADDVAARTKAGALHPNNKAATVLDALTIDELTVRAAGQLGEPIRRSLPGMGLEAYVLSAGALAKGTAPTSPGWLRAKLARMFRGYQRAHLIGPGFGGEEFAGLMLAPRGVNQLVQNKGIEKILRDSVPFSDVHIVAVARGREISMPLAGGGAERIRVLEDVTYHVMRPDGRPATFVNAQGRTVKVAFTIDIDPGVGWKVHHNLPPGVLDPKLKLSGRY